MTRRLTLPLLIALATAFPAYVLAADPPTTTITGGPNGSSYETSPQFTFSSDAADATFECSLDGAAFVACTSPHKIGPLAQGSHTFAVRAVGSDGQPDPAPPTRSWTVVPPLDTPVVKLIHPAKRTISIKKLGEISGTAKAPSGVTRIQVTLQKGGPDKSVFPPRCAYFDMRSATKTLQPCLLPAYFAAKGTTRWHYKSAPSGRAVLTPGKYTLIVRAFNPYGQASQTRFALTLR